MGAHLLVFAVAAVGTYFITFAVRRISLHLGWVVAPDERRVHERPTPIGGGVAMYVAFLLAMLVASQLGRFDDAFSSSSEPFGVLLAATLILVVGLIDDVREVSPPARMAATVLAASILYFLGVSMFYFRVPFAELVVVSSDLAPLATVLWVAGMVWAINLIDGLDGLAAGIVAIGAGAFAVYGERLANDGLLAPDNIGPLIAVIVCGVCVGFLPHNFHPAKIFMGDAGAMLLGLLMATSTLVVGGRIDDEFSGQTYFFYAPIFIPLFILGVPIIDTAFAILRRAVGRRGVAVADKEHLHHRLMRLGHGQRRAVVILWLWTAILSGFVLYPTFAKRGNQFIPFGVAALGVGLYTYFHPGIRRMPPGEPPQLPEASSSGNGDAAPTQWRRTTTRP